MSNVSTAKQIKLEEAKVNLEAAQEEMTELYDSLETKISELEETIMSDFDKGQDLRAQMHCYELQNCEAQRDITGKICYIIYTKLVDMTTASSIIKVGKTLRECNKIVTITPADVKAFDIHAGSRNNAIIKLLGKNLDINNAATKATFNKMKDRYTRLKVQEAGEALENQNSSSHKTGN